MRLKWPDLEVGDKTNSFEKQRKAGKPSIPSVIAEMQESYNEVQQPALEAEAVALARKEKGKVEQALRDVLGRQKLRAVGDKECGGFQNFFKEVEDKECYIFKCHGGKHAYGGYF